jgi:hypothetical protein
MLVGFNGFEGAGKTASANHLTKNKFTKLAFATPLKKTLELWGFDHENVYGTQKQKLLINKTWNVSGRSAMIGLGEGLKTNAAKMVPGMSADHNFWIKIFDATISNVSGNVVIEDVRFKHEAEYILSKGGIIIQLLREPKNNKIHKANSLLDNQYITHTVDNQTYNLEQLHTALDMTLDFHDEYKKSEERESEERESEERESEERELIDLEISIKKKKLKINKLRSDLRKEEKRIKKLRMQMF